jgi:tetratricopeptide (TPR) repeat protein
MKNRVILALTILGCSLTLAAQRMSLDPQQQYSQRGHNSSHENSSISGTVQDMNNQRLKDVRVELRDASGNVVNSTFTNSSGDFEFNLIAAGGYIVVATTGMDQVSEQVQVAGWSSVVSLRMPSNKPQDGMAGNAMVSVAQYRIPAKARDEYRKAHEAMEKGNLDETNKHLARALELCPEYAEALTLRGVLELDQKDVASALTNLDQAIHADPNYPMAYMVMGSAFNTQSRFDEAIRSLERAETLAPSSWQIHFEMAKSYIGKEDYPLALHQLEQAQTTGAAQYPLISLLQGYSLLKMKQYSQAADMLQAYLQKDPQGPNSQQARKMLEQAHAFMAAK